MKQITHFPGIKYTIPESFIKTEYGSHIQIVGLHAAQETFPDIMVSTASPSYYGARLIIFVFRE